ncbi:T9SS type A sorting domain-containing protein [Dyadobacter fermentans]|uniref:Secretion system C-terminal sorting domain-containing protein n=1 Tax=Dyadobacter fermentans (strain ATCC 700827 / DSM 18053 / CIP 107007 / KCTC 52180 / NS114) TaxID=471854 RepID=C6VUL2_DYAFD|nr:T9SS type A sorting domain-containing protein [Dyadobacter fermentans]ACT91321.1 hypothetical protein Dfer_0049 [Dyadobacter fermentans DSM 18053]
MKRFYSRVISAFVLALISLVGFGQGIIKTERSSPQGIVSFSQSSKVVGAGDSKHIDGYVEKSGSGIFLFPVGHKGMYRPFAAESDGVIGAYFQENAGSASLPAGAPFSTGNKESALKNVSGIEFWDINGANPSRLTLTWNATSNVGTLTGNSLPLLTIAGWNAATSKWEAVISMVDEVAYQGGTSSMTSGSITTIQTVVPNKYSVYTLASLNSPTVQVSYEGSLETLSCSEIAGWVWNKNYPDAALTVELFEGSTVYATARAEINRTDLKESGKGSGNYGFKIATPASLIDGKTHQLSIRVKGSSFTLAGSPKTLNCGITGAFEVADCYKLSGWVWDKNMPGSALTVEIKEGNVVHATSLADVYREDLLNGGAGTGKYGFSIPLPATLKDGKSHVVSATAKGIEYTLTNSPKSVNCPVSQFAGRFEKADCESIQGWVWDANYPNAALTVEVVENGVVYATGVANVYRESLKTSGYGTGNYVFRIPTPAILRDGKAHQLSVRVKGTGTIISDSPRSLTCSVNDYGGLFDFADCDIVRGWAWDKNFPNGAALTVELVKGDVVYGSAVASNYREDLKNAGTGTGNYGFSMAMPAALRDGKAHQLSIRVKGSSYLLPGYPGTKTLTCEINRYAGSFERAECGLIQGWIWDKNNPGTSVTVEVVEGTTVHATGIANIYRESLNTSGFGTGNYVFQIATPASLKDGKPHQLSIRAKGSSTILSNSPRSLTCAANEYDGVFEFADCDVVRGWVWDKNFPNGAALTVELVEGTVVHGTAVAGTYREDLKAKGNGKYGFSMALPAALRDGKSHQLSVRVKGSNYTLVGYPGLKTLTCEVNRYAGSFERAECGVIQGWIWDKNNPGTSVTVEVVEGTTVHATGIANVYREALKTSGFGTGNYVFQTPTPASLKDGKPHQISIRAKGSSFVLTNSPRSLTCAVNSYAGAFEFADCDVVRGWAWDKNFPGGAALTVELVEGTIVHGTALASSYRADLKSNGTGTGNYGFSMPLPPALRDGKAHQLSFRVKGSSILLSGSKTLTCEVNRYAGRFERAECGSIQGWVWDKNNPGTSVTVEVLEGGIVHATGVANIYRESLKTSGYGSGNYVFQIPTPASIKDGKAHQLSVRVKGSSVILTDSPRSLTCPVNDYDGIFEFADCDVVRGWAWDKNFPNGASLTVELVEGTTVHGTATAGSYREDLKVKGNGTGNYGFSMALPAALRDGKPHQLSIRVKGSNYILSGYPGVKSLTCEINRYAGRFERAECGMIQGWIWDKNNPGAVVTVEVMEGTTLLATGVASIYRESLKLSGFGTGNYVFQIPTPASLKDGKAHQLSIRAKGSSFILTDSPRSLSCAVAARIAAPAHEISVSENHEGLIDELRFFVFPNPSKGTLTVALHAAKDKLVNLSIINILGQSVHKSTLASMSGEVKTTVDLGQLPDGIYIVQVKVGDKIESRRVVLAK